MTFADCESVVPALLEVAPAPHIRLIRDGIVRIDKRCLDLAKGCPEQVKEALVEEVLVPVQESFDDVELRACRGLMCYGCAILNVIQLADGDDSHAIALSDYVVQYELVLMNLAGGKACPLEEVGTVELPPADYVLNRVPVRVGVDAGPVAALVQAACRFADRPQEIAVGVDVRHAAHGHVQTLLHGFDKQFNLLRPKEVVRVEEEDVLTRSRIEPGVARGGEALVALVDQDQRLMPSSVIAEYLKRIICRAVVDGDDLEVVVRLRIH